MMTLNFRRHDGAFPKPDRSGVSRRFAPDEFTGETDLGFAEGEFSDGRPFRAETWCWRDLTSVTFFFSRRGLEGQTAEELTALLQGEVDLRFPGERSVTATRERDAAGSDLWSVCVIVRHGGETWAETGLKFRPYEEEAEREAAAACLERPELRPWGVKS